MKLGCDSSDKQSSHKSQYSDSDRQPASGSDLDDSDEDIVQHGFKKIKPVDGLVLKTPIAFRNDSDLDMIPIRKEGMAVCEKCGAIGVKHSFYTKERRFCSQACAKSFNENPQANSVTLEKRYSLQCGLQPGQQPANRKMGQSVDDVHIFSNKKRMQLAKDGTEKDTYGFDWVEMLTDFGFVTPPISCFRHAPVCDTWASDVSVGMKVEVENTDTRQPANNGDPQSYWVASVISLMGYKALLRYEGFGNDDSKDFWVNLAAEDVHPVGWCASKGKPLIPPRTIQDKYTEWREFLVKRLTGARSLPNQFHSRVIEASRSRFRVGMTLELVDRHNLSTIRVATVETIIGRRLKLRYVDSFKSEADSIVWCHEESTLIHPVGWALSVGHQIDASAAYLDRCAKRNYLPTDATGELFNEMKPAAGTQSGLKFKEGMKLEAVDPLNLDKICVGSVVKVLRHGYIMIRVDRKPDEDDEDAEAANEDTATFCYHATSACIAPPGFCEANAITLQPPAHYEGGRFRWGDYLRSQKAVAAPEALFSRAEDFQTPTTTGAPATTVPQMRVGMRVEAADLMDSRLVCVATVAQVAGRLVRIHFDGWTDEFDQWMDSASPELYPVGWCELAGYRLETPEAGNLNQVQTAAASTTANKKKTKTASTRGGGGGPGRGKSRRGRPPHASVNPVKRERSPEENRSTSSSKAPKLNNQVVPAAAIIKSQSQERAVRSLRPRSTTQPQSGEDTSEEVDNGSATTDGNFNDQIKLDIPKPTNGAAAAAASNKKIPKLIDVTTTQRKEALAGVDIADWSPSDVTEFLRINGYTVYSDAFAKEMVDGPMLLLLTKDRILQLTGMKVGPTLKIMDLISQLKPTRTSTNGSARPGLQSPPLR